ncbi:Rrf2 family transcriptional regulator, partial [Burkholderia pseudomallei]
LDGATLADLVGAPPKSGLSTAEKTNEFAIAMPPKSIARARS